MKRILLQTIFCIMLFSCKKEQTLPIAVQIFGNWHHLKTVNPEIVQTSPPDTAKNIIFGRDGSFQRRHNDSVLFKGTYNLTEKKDCYRDENKFLLRTSDQPIGIGEYVKIINDTLILNTPNCYADGGVTIYIKK